MGIATTAIGISTFSLLQDQVHATEHSYQKCNKMCIESKIGIKHQIFKIIKTLHLRKTIIAIPHHILVKIKPLD